MSAIQLEPQDVAELEVRAHALAMSFAAMARTTTREASRPEYETSSDFWTRVADQCAAAMEQVTA